MLLSMFFLIVDASSFKDTFGERTITPQWRFISTEWMDDTMLTPSVEL
jgi:hypothetical protein